MKPMLRRTEPNRQNTCSNSPTPLAVKDVVCDGRPATNLLHTHPPSFVPKGTSLTRGVVWAMLLYGQPTVIDKFSPLNVNFFESLSVLFLFFFLLFLGGPMGLKKPVLRTLTSVFSLNRKEMSGIKTPSCLGLFYTFRD